MLWADSHQLSAPPGTASAAENRVQGRVPFWGFHIQELTDVGHEGHLQPSSEGPSAAELTIVLVKAVLGRIPGPPLPLSEPASFHRC